MIPGLASRRRPGLILMIGVLSAALFSPSASRAQQVWTGAPPVANPIPAAADLNLRLEAMDRELRRLGGEISRPELDNAVTRLARDLEALRADQRRFQADVDRRLRDLEARSGAPRPGLSGATLSGPMIQPDPVRIDPPGASGFVVETRPPAPPQVGLAMAPVGLGAPVLRDEPPSMPIMGLEGIEVSAPGLRMPAAAPPSLRVPTMVVDAAPDLGDMDIGVSAPRPSLQPAPLRAAAVPAGASPQSDYDAALRLLETGGADQALDLFGRIVGAAPNDPVAGSAQYWIGDIHFRKAEYDLAARAFLDSFRRWPEGPKGPESLLRLGMTLAATGKHAEACAAFAQVSARYPGAAPDVLGRARIETQRNQCS
ncbi:tetratricopeptide repeat protein [Neomegalonema sp.]|uniref:tetratricopeptide repeat protein n=1 Tax=Neomegalonema sp. TaxID=2039713 RepID=UPI002638E8A7|nr:tetratricopeptide repeat protein [Neomegalonema sp.]MDD2869379.1 tetratricopeptide repeat protein [Neomegalonema sp.]